MTIESNENTFSPRYDAFKVFDQEVLYFYYFTMNTSAVYIQQNREAVKWSKYKRNQ